MKAVVDGIPRNLSEVGRDDVAALLLSLARAKIEHDEDRAERVLRILGELFAAAFIYADLRGREDAFRDLERGLTQSLGVRVQLLEDDLKPSQFAAVLPHVPFEEAIDDMLARRPMLAKNQRELEEKYVFDHAFAAVQATELAVTKRVQKAVADGLAGSPDPRSAIQAIAGWTEAYADTVWRTNMTTAYAAGRLRQATDPSLGDLVVGLRFVAVGDSDTRPNHKAADGVVAGPEDPIWTELSPPLGFNCRCRLDLVDRFEAEREGLLRDGALPRATLPRGAGRDPGFFSDFSYRPDTVVPRTADPAESSLFPLRQPNPTARPMGKPKVERGAGASHRGIVYENRTGQYLAQLGFRTTQLEDAQAPEDRGMSNPDFLINGQIWEGYSPEFETDIKKAVRVIGTKANSQSQKIVLNLDDIAAAGEEFLENWIQEVIHRVKRHNWRNRNRKRLDIQKVVAVYILGEVIHFRELFPWNSTSHSMSLSNQYRKE